MRASRRLSTGGAPSSLVYRHNKVHEKSCDSTCKFYLLMSARLSDMFITDLRAAAARRQSANIFFKASHQLRSFSIWLSLLECENR